MKTKHFKSRHALLMSLTSLMLCVSMLFGATFAWFTDSVTSGVNRIVSGNLDVELYHSNDSTAEEKVQATTQLFKAAYIDNAAVNPHQLWEPGAMTYETFRVENKGSLALTYQLNLSDIAYNYVTWGEDTTQYNLTQVIKVGLIPNTAAISRNTVKQYATQNLKDLLSETTATMKTASLEPGASESFTVALYWAEADNTTDNHYNLKNGVKSEENPNGYTLTNPTGENATQLYIDSRVTLFATLYTSESDSFDNQYDKSAATSSIPAFDNASVISTTAAVTAGEDTNLTVGNLATATVPATAASTLKDEDGQAIVTDSNTLTSLTLEVTELEVTPTTGSQDEATIAITSAIQNDNEAAGSTIQSFDVSLFATTTTETTLGDEITKTSNTTAVKSSAELITATLNIGAGKVITKVYHRSDELTETANATGEYYKYNSDTGILTLYVKSFSPFAVAYKVPATGIALDETAEVAVGKTVTLTATLTPADSTDSVTWTSSDPKIATVDPDGKVTGVALGTATITASVNGVSDSCEVKVFKDYVRGRNNLSYNDIADCTTDSDFLPTASINPTINKYSYKNEDNSLITSEVHFCFYNVEKKEIDNSSYRVVIDMAIKDDKGNDLELKPGAAEGFEYFKCYLNPIEVLAGYSVSSVTVNGAALTKKTTDTGNPALGEYWVGDGNGVYFNSRTAGLIEVTLTKNA